MANQTTRCVTSKTHATVMRLMKTSIRAPFSGAIILILSLMTAVNGRGQARNTSAVSSCNLFVGALVTAMFKGSTGQFAEVHTSLATVHPAPIQDQT
jgi:hypothetical protein